MDNPSKDAALLRQARQNSRFYFSVAYRILGDAEAAEDACQQAFMKGWQSKEQLRHAGGVGKWLTQTVINESLQLLRRRKVEAKALPEQARVQRERWAVVPPGHALEMREQVRVALEQIPQPTRTVLVLRLMQGLSGNQVKDVLGCSASEVSRRLHDGMKKMRQILESQGEMS